MQITLQNLSHDVDYITNYELRCILRYKIWATM